MIAALDDGVGMITSALDSMGLSDNTLIIFCSDNGGATYTEATDNGSLKAGKFSQFEGGVNIPMIISWGNMLNGGSIYSNPVCLLDLFPTITAATNICTPDDRIYDGVDLVPFLNRNDENPHEYLYWRTEFNRTYLLWDAEMISPSWPGVMEFKFDIDGEVTWWAI
jgi:arylsulfatase A-like enzyme